MSDAISLEVGHWVQRTTFGDLPQDVVQATKLRVLDVVGLSLAGAETGFGRSVREAAIAMSSSGPCHILGTGDQVGVTMAAFANGSFSQALEYDDTHLESIVHMSSPSVAAALALAELSVAGPVSGQELIAAVAIGNEISCRVGSVSPGQFHRLGFHPSGLFAPFGVSYLAGRLLELDAQRLAYAAGIVGSFAAGLLECWVDGTQPKFLHPGWAAQSGISAAFLARAGTNGPGAVFDGRFGLYSSHLQDRAVARDFSRITNGLGSRWDSRNASFKPFPVAHVIHPYIDALWRVQRREGFQASDVERIDCPVAAFIVPIVCEPLAEKLAPASDSHGRVSLQYTLAEALYRGVLGKHAYQPESLANPEILALAARVRYQVDPEFPGPGHFKGVVHVTLKDGRCMTEVEEFTRGSSRNPMTIGELGGKFDENASGFLSRPERDRLADIIARLEQLPDAGVLAGLAIGAPRGSGNGTL
jgi:2-methylcitrate dehydratase PrpD